MCEDERNLEGRLNIICNKDINTLIAKEKVYRGSWKKRGGTGAFMVLARKWDRIEVQCEEAGYDILAILNKEYSAGEEFKPDSLMDDIRDLRCYLLLVEQEIMRQNNTYKTVSPEYKTTGYGASGT